MPITITDTKIYLSGGAGNTNAASSLGGVRSNTEYTAPLVQLFDRVAALEAQAGDTEYRCVYIRNTHATLTWEDLRVFIQSQTSSVDTSVEIGHDPAGINGTATTIASEGDVPTGVVFGTPSTFGNAVVIGNMVPGAQIAIWIKRIVDASAVSVVDDYVLEFIGETGP